MADFDSRFGLPLARIQVITTLAGANTSPWLASPEEAEDTDATKLVTWSDSSSPPTSSSPRARP